MDSLLRLVSLFCFLLAPEVIDCLAEEVEEATESLAFMAYLESFM